MQDEDTARAASLYTAKEKVKAEAEAEAEAKEKVDAEAFRDKTDASSTPDNKNAPFALSDGDTSSSDNGNADDADDADSSDGSSIEEEIDENVYSDEDDDF